MTENKPVPPRPIPDRITWAGPTGLALVVAGAVIGSWIPFGVFLILFGVLIGWTKLPPAGAPGRRLHLATILLGLMCLAVFIVITIVLGLSAS